MNSATGIAQRSEVLTSPLAQPDACGRCHSRRLPITETYEHGQSLQQTHLPSLLEQGLYHPDGQIQSEVYVWGSFLQSKMYEAGVTCSDCHEPHSGKLRSAGQPSAVCAQCHLPSAFQVIEHHGHPGDSVECVDCHMPTATYMEIDDRRDHSFRVPRPDLSVELGTPNACNSCHTERSAAWAAQMQPHREDASGRFDFARALYRAREGLPGANAELLDVTSNRSYPGIARATALTLLVPPISRRGVETITRALSDADGLVRLGAVRAAERVGTDEILDAALSALKDPLRTVRVEAAGAQLRRRDRAMRLALADYAEAENEYLLAHATNAERPEAYLAIGNMFAARGDLVRAERSYESALLIDSDFVAARVNLADIYRSAGSEADTRRILLEGLEASPDSAAIAHALGLHYSRSGDEEKSVRELARAAELAPDDARFAYVHAIALNSPGGLQEALSAMRSAHERFPGDFDIAFALATLQRDAGDSEGALETLSNLEAGFPDQPTLGRLRTELERIQD